MKNIAIIILVISYANSFNFQKNYQHKNISNTDDDHEKCQNLDQKFTDKQNYLDHQLFYDDDYDYSQFKKDVETFINQGATFTRVCAPYNGIEDSQFCQWIESELGKIDCNSFSKSRAQEVELVA